MEEPKEHELAIAIRRNSPVEPTLLRGKSRHAPSIFRSPRPLRNHAPVSCDTFEALRLIMDDPTRLTDALEQVPKARGAGRSGPRRRTGCLTCRARKVRCDETKPSCANCDRLRLRCVYKAPVSHSPAWASSRRSNDSATTQTAPRPASSPPLSSASGAAAPAAVADSAQRSPDVNFFSTVLRSDDHHRTIPAPANPIQRLPTDSESYSQELGGSFDMLSFMGGITSDLEQKHVDLTSGLAPFPTSSTPQSLPAASATPNAEEGQTGGTNQSPFSPGAPSSVVDGSVDSASDAPATRRSWSDPGNVSYEDQLIQYFAAIDPPAGIFAPITMEWKYVVPTVLTYARDFSPLLNALYCYVDIHKAVAEGKRWRWAPTYHQVSSSEIQKHLLGDVAEPTLIKIFATVFFLMLSEVSFSPCFPLMISFIKKTSYSHPRNYVLWVPPIYVHLTFCCNNFTTALNTGLGLVISWRHGYHFLMSKHSSQDATETRWTSWQSPQSEQKILYPRESLHPHQKLVEIKRTRKGKKAPRTSSKVPATLSTRPS